MKCIAVAMMYETHENLHLVDNKDQLYLLHETRKK